MAKLLRGQANQVFKKLGWGLGLRGCGLVFRAWSLLQECWTTRAGLREMFCDSMTENSTLYVLTGLLDVLSMVCVSN